MHIGYDGESVHGSIDGFTAKWCAAFIGQKWLLSSVSVDGIRGAWGGDKVARW